MKHYEDLRYRDKTEGERRGGGEKEERESESRRKEGRGEIIRVRGREGRRWRKGGRRGRERGEGE